MSDWNPKCTTHHDACDCREMRHANDKIKLRNEILELTRERDAAIADSAAMRKILDSVQFEIKNVEYYCDGTHPLYSSMGTDKICEKCGISEDAPSEKRWRQEHTERALLAKEILSRESPGRDLLARLERAEAVVEAAQYCIDQATEYCFWGKQKLTEALSATNSESTQQKDT